MFRTKAALIAFAVAVAAIALGACGSSDGDDQSYEILMIAAPPGDDFYYTVEQGARERAEELGVNLEVQQIAKYEPSAQLPVLDAAIAKRPDAILIGPTEESALQASLEKASEQGIEIVLYDTTTEDPSVAVTFVSGDIVELGRNAAKTQTDLIDGEGKVFYAGSAPSQTFFDSLREGWTEVMDAEPGIEQLPVTYSDYEPSKANSQMQATLTANPDLAGGFVGIFLDQQGIVPALERGGVIDEVETVGVDGAPQNIERLENGQVDAIVSVKAHDYGTEAVQAAVDALEGEEVPAETVVGQCVLTAETLDDPANQDCLYEKAPSE